MTTQRKLLVVSGLLALGLLLAACGPTPEKSSTGPEQNPQSAKEPTSQLPTNQPEFAPPGTESDLKPVECPQGDLLALVWEQLEKQTKEISSEEQLRERLDAIVEQLRKDDQARGGEPITHCEVIAPEAFAKEGFKESLIDYLVEELRKAGRLGFLGKS